MKCRRCKASTHANLDLCDRCIMADPTIGRGLTERENDRLDALMAAPYALTKLERAELRGLLRRRQA
jgi:hypothetical protein